jgi:hypothetical protein
MKFKDLEGKRLVGIMELQHADDDGRLLIIIEAEGKKKVLVASSQNDDGMYSWYDNWFLEEREQLPEDINKTYKSIGDLILSVTFDGIENETGSIKADMEKWTKAVGEGSWGPAEEDYYFITIQTQTKTIRLGAHYYDCHYPTTIWDIPSASVSDKESRREKE